MISGVTSSIEVEGDCNGVPLRLYRRDGAITRREMFEKIDHLIKTKQLFQLTITKMVNQEALSFHHGYMKTEQLIDESMQWLCGQVVQVSKQEDFYISQFESGTFAVLIPGFSPNEVILKLHRSLNRGFVSKNSEFDHPQINIHFHVGNCRSSGSNLCVNQVVRNAEEALKRHEEAMCTSGDVQSKSELTFSSSDLIKAMNDDQLELWYQPKVNMGTNEIIGVEALIRWRHPEYGLLSPASFLGWYNAYKLTGNLNRWVIFEGFRKCRELLDEGENLTVALNLDASSLTDSVTMQAIETAQKRYKVPPSQIEFEIVETVVIGKGDKKFKALNHLKEIGYRIAIDDFGTGANNIAYLMYMPADTIKLDRMFCSTIDDDRTLALTKAAIDMARASKLTIVAEGVETEEQGEIMASLGCDIAQGYFYGKPEPTILRKV
ncbi:EAL domain-containing protein [Vibrio alginolyticus]